MPDSNFQPDDNKQLQAPALKLEADGGGNAPPPRKTAIGTGGSRGGRFHFEPGQIVACIVLEQRLEIYSVREVSKQVEGLLASPGINLEIGSTVFCKFRMMSGDDPIFADVQPNPAGKTFLELNFLFSEASGELQALLSMVDKQPGVIGSFIVGHDGLLIAETIGSKLLKDSLLPLCLSIFPRTATFVKSVGHTRLHQVILSTTSSQLVLADFGGGILGVLLQKDFEYLIPTMRAVTQLVIA